MFVGEIIILIKIEGRLIMCLFIFIGLGIFLFYLVFYFNIIFYIYVCLF